MDGINRLQTKTTFMLIRAEYGLALGVCVVAFLGHIDEVRWIPAARQRVGRGAAPGAVVVWPARRPTPKRW